jgi:hypothetical protein
MEVCTETFNLTHHTHDTHHTRIKGDERRKSLTISIQQITMIVTDISEKMYNRHASQQKITKYVGAGRDGG